MKKGVMIGVIVCLGLILSMSFVSAGLVDWFKGFFVKLVCKISHLFNSENYEKCVVDRFGLDIDEVEEA